MSERSFRLIQGIYLLSALFLELDILIYIFIGVFAFEAITNWRVPMMVSRLRYGKRENENKVTETKTSKFNFEAERMLRVVVIALLVVSFILYPELLWFVPWFIGVMLSVTLTIVL